jgi:spermidine synthase
VSSDGSQAFPYGVMIIDLLSSHHAVSPIDSALVIGLGGGVIVQDLGEYVAKVDAVEIDHKVVAVARKYFSYQEARASKTYITDGRRFVRENTHPYDAIILDAFSGVSPATHLYTKEAFEEMKKALNPKGVLVVNTIGYATGEKGKLQHALYETMHDVFPEVLAVSTENIKEDSEAFGNIIFLASSEKIVFPYSRDFVVHYSEESETSDILVSDDQNGLEILGLPIFKESRNFYKHFLYSL